MASKIEALVLKIGLYRIFKVFKFVRAIYLALVYIINLVFGVNLILGTKEEQEQAKTRFDKSGHVLRIIGRGTKQPAEPVSLGNFILRHEEYVDPVDYVLNNDNVTLWGLDADKAWFCVTEPEVTVYDTSKIPFAFINQYLLAKKILVVPTSSLKQLGKKAGSPGGNCVIINNTGRCGSTLICQMFNKLPNTLVMSEPWGLIYAHRMFLAQEINWQGYQDLIKFLVCLQFKATKKTETERYVLKLPLLLAPIVKPIHDLFGSSIKYLFVTRHLRPSMISFVKVITSFGTEDPNSKGDFWYDHLGLPYTPEYKAILDKYKVQKRTATHATNLALAMGGALLSYLNKRDIYAHHVFYEELIDDVANQTRTMFGKLQVPDQFVAQAITAMRKHSQNHMFGDGALNTADLIPKKDWDEAEEVFKEIKLPVSASMTVEQFQKVIKDHKG